MTIQTRKSGLALAAIAVLIAIGSSSCKSGGGGGGGGGGGSVGPSAWTLITRAEMFQSALAIEIDQWWGLDGFDYAYYQWSTDRVYVGPNTDPSYLRLDFNGSYAYVYGYSGSPWTYRVYNNPTVNVYGFLADIHWGLTGGYPWTATISWGVDLYSSESVTFVNTNLTGFETQSRYIDKVFGTEISGVILGGGLEYGDWIVDFVYPDVDYTTDPSNTDSVDADVEWDFYLFPFASSDAYYW